MRRRISPELNELGQRVAEWREREGGRGSRIPLQLWNDAVRVARVVGVWATAKALHFNYEALRKRVDLERAVGKVQTLGAKRGRHAGRAGATQAKRAKVMANGAQPAEIVIASAASANGHAAGPSFIALEMGQLCAPGRTVIDLVGRHGDRMRVDVGSGVDIVGLVQTFWRREP
jgi:hypothetical protein